MTVLPLPSSLYVFAVIQFIDTHMAFREVDVGVNPRPRAMEVDSGEKRLNELGYKQELRREMVQMILWLYVFYLYMYLNKKSWKSN